ncbi:SRPBCC family protein [Amycolatopsis australiensis]|uniref:Polyketide cyclase / dehydrase and lipid transport n=1 Tax=Amycolatopsis australiensis TaxID=546364 RepID=A0A1K1RNF3_9PSEU|nr:SRPBCC family protein [Amycolatopsis australiensis]SFW73231.1 Polyketide cyclase / dehydrase and lipid transport [Amycolatopsis australiensis]
MATLRSHTVIDADADVVWRVLSDGANVADWFPAMAESTGDAEGRTVTLRDGSKLEEAVVTKDAYLRRFQYRVVGGDLAVEHHLGTVDVIDLGNGSCLVVYGTEIEPESTAAAFDGAIGEAVANLPAFFARRHGIGAAPTA